MDLPSFYQSVQQEIHCGALVPTIWCITVVEGAFGRLLIRQEIPSYIPYLKKVTEYGPRICTVKLGSRGALVYDKKSGECYHVPAYSTENVVDVTGCGDCFCGSFITSFINDEDIFVAAMKAAVSASFNIEHYGCLENFQIPYDVVRDRYEAFSHTVDREKCRLL